MLSFTKTPETSAKVNSTKLKKYQDFSTKLRVFYKFCSKKDGDPPSPSEGWLDFLQLLWQAMWCSQRLLSESALEYRLLLTTKTQNNRSKVFWQRTLPSTVQYKFTISALEKAGTPQNMNLGSKKLSINHRKSYLARRLTHVPKELAYLW